MIKKAIDRQKVIKALELCKYDPDPGQMVKHLHSCIHCPYWNDGVVPECSVMYTDAIALLEQEAVEPKVTSAEQRCGNCNKVIEMDGWKSCPWCGKPIA